MNEATERDGGNLAARLHSEHAPLQAELHSCTVRTLGGAAVSRALAAPSTRARDGSSCAPHVASPIFSSLTDVPPKRAILLEPVVAAITEGHDTLDYVYAEGLLRTLS